MEFKQIFALAIFLFMFVAIVWGKVHRFIPALLAALVVIFGLFLGVMHSPATALGALNLEQLGKLGFWLPPGGGMPENAGGVNWQTIIFIAGMMIMVAGLERAGVFRWLCLWVARLAKYKPVTILVAFTLLAGVMAMFVDSITVLLFLAMVTIELSRLLKFDPVPLIIAEIFAANVGGAATMCGDPPNIIIGTSLGFSFTDFLANTGPIAFLALIAATLYFFLVFRKQLEVREHIDTSRCPLPAYAIWNRHYFAGSCIIFLSVIGLLITHAQTGFSVALIGVVAAGLTLIAARGAAIEIIKKLDWKTLVFFIGLFIVVTGLEMTGLLDVLARFIGTVSGGSDGFILVVILWFSAFASALVDNIPFAATMVPVIRALSIAQGVSLGTLSWALALGTDIGGNGTPIGASANVVGISIAEKEGHPVRWGRFLKIALPAMLFTIALCSVYLLLRYM
jgi:Na+/H+ antiporter NhaD/arsenite permease-like protein